MTAKEWLIAVIVLALAAGVGIPLVGSFLRSRDFQAQVDGKKPPRDAGEKRVPDAAALASSEKRQDYESTKAIAELKSKQNVLGPK